ncbi:MAG: peptidoglycan-binding protein [Acidimicrobiales bacterium]
MTDSLRPLSMDDLDQERATPLPDKEVMSLLDLNIDIDLALDLAAPIDLAVAANANIAAAIDASVSANVLSFDSVSQAIAHQQTMIDQYLAGQAIAHAPQTAAIDQANDVVDAGTHDAPVVDTMAEPVTHTDTTDVHSSVISDADAVTTGSIFDDGLLNVNVDVDVDADMAAPIAGAVAANANVAAPIDAAVSANILSFDSASSALADQTAVITQHLEGLAQATAAQDADIVQ